MKKVDVLLLCQFFYPEYVSSATLPLDTAIALSSSGLTVNALCGYPKEYNLLKDVPVRETYENIEIRRLKYMQLKRSNFMGRLINYFSFTFSVALHLGELRKYKSIIVYTNPPILPLVATLANKLFKTKIILVSYDVYPEVAYKTNSISESSIISKIMRTANRSIFKRVTRVVALSDEMKEYLLKHRQTLSDSRIEVIANWCDDESLVTYTNNELFKSILGEENIVISYFGNMGVCQDIDTIIMAIREVKQDSSIKFLFAGHGNKMENLKDIVTKERLKNVMIFDFLHGKDFQDALKISDCFILSLEDGLSGLCVPSKTYSYMMAGKPIVAIMSEHSEIAKDLKENEAGFVIGSGESNKLVDIIRALQIDDEKRRQMGINCRNVYLEKYTKSFCTQKYVNMMKGLLEE